MSYAKVIEAFEPFRKALYANDSDTMGALSNGDTVLFSLMGSWTPKQEVTLGDLRNLDKVLRELKDD